MVIAKHFPRKLAVQNEVTLSNFNHTVNFICSEKKHNWKLRVVHESLENFIVITANVGPETRRQLFGQNLPRLWVQFFLELQVVLFTNLQSRCSA